MIYQQGFRNHAPEVLSSQTFTINVDLVRLACISYPCGVYGGQQWMDGWMDCVGGVWVCVGVWVCPGQSPTPRHSGDWV